MVAVLMVVLAVFFIVLVSVLLSCWIVLGDAPCISVEA